MVVDFPIAFVKRPLLTDENGNLLSREVRRATDFFPGAQLIIRDRASASANDTVISDGVFPADENGDPALIDIKI